MTDSTRQASRLCIPITAAALMLAGCSATHVGDSWQCPLTQGEVCASIAAADPAVADAAGPDRPVNGNPAPQAPQRFRDGRDECRIEKPGGLQHGL